MLPRGAFQRSQFRVTLPNFHRLSRQSRGVGNRSVISCVFTGIVQGTAFVKSTVVKDNLSTLELKFPEDLSSTVSIGSSVAINGTCLTATSVNSDVLTFDAMRETLSVTNLDELQEGSSVNYEKAARFGDEIGGHTVSGHIHTVAVISGIETASNDCRMTFTVPSPWMKYIFNKGFLAVDGVSLTSCEVTDATFSVYLIPETLRMTTLSDRKIGDRVNIEVESQTQAIVDTVERVMKQYTTKLQPTS